MDSAVNVRLGTRSSMLAMAQAEAVRKLLSPFLGPVELVKIQTSGDRGDRDRLGAFVSEIEQALRDGRVDIGLHCLKDLPTRPKEGLCIAAFLEREDARDALLTAGCSFAELNSDAVVGTGSVRRSSQLSAHSRKFVYKPLVGNVDSRLAKLKRGEYDAIVLAVAGLKRLGMLEDWSESAYADVQIELLDTAVMVPAAGQAALVLQMREEDPLRSTVASLNHLPTQICTESERAFLGRFGGGCSVPVAAFAEPEGEHYSITGLVSTPDGSLSFRDTKTYGSDQGEFFGRQLAEELGLKGGFDIVNSLTGAAAS